MANRKNKQQNPGKVIIPVNHPNPPEKHEVDTATILACHFQCTIEFLVPIDDFKRKTADIKMLGVEWELKCPIGDSQSTIQSLFRRASKQAKNVIIDTCRTKLTYDVIFKRVLFEIKKHPYLKRIILVDKSKKVVEVKG